MRYLLLSDLHANLEAFDACLEMSKGQYDRVVCLGDIVGYGPDPGPVLDRIREQTSTIIRGNHDKACSGVTDAEDFNPWAKAAVHWTRSCLDADQLDFLRKLPVGPLKVENFVIVHGSVPDEDEYVSDSTDALPLIKMQEFPIVFFGHTHLQGGFSLNAEGRLEQFAPDHRGAAGSARDGCVASVEISPGSRYLLNPGSVGQPRDGNWRAAFAIYDSAVDRVEYYRTSYDVSETQRKMRLAGLPEPLIRRIEMGR